MRTARLAYQNAVGVKFVQNLQLRFNGFGQTAHPVFVLIGLQHVLDAERTGAATASLALLNHADPDCQCADSLVGRLVDGGNLRHAFVVLQPIFQ